MAKNTFQRKIQHITVGVDQNIHSQKYITGHDVPNEHHDLSNVIGSVKKFVSMEKNTSFLARISI
jgi:hypothetical protein